MVSVVPKGSSILVAGLAVLLDLKTEIREASGSDQQKKALSKGKRIGPTRSNGTIGLGFASSSSSSSSVYKPRQWGPCSQLERLSISPDLKDFSSLSLLLDPQGNATLADNLCIEEGPPIEGKGQRLTHTNRDSLESSNRVVVVKWLAKLLLNSNNTNAYLLLTNAYLQVGRRVGFLFMGTQQEHRSGGH
ncbi:uncharacterized protein LOC127809371 [Diospyros lotus]|uniref:uncharacterized protein LOC127809371 n=1 Tax=Diospyros lotus TaxID=55363 RepID=UPI00225BBB44|nr:uncharacterized protein LOC127809371 [Diospyros lotus]